MSSCPPTWADTSATGSPASASSRGMACWSSPVPAGAFRWRSWCGRTDAPGREAVHVLGLRRAAPDPRRPRARRARAAAPARGGAGGVDLLPHVRLLPPAPRLHDRLRQRLRPVGRARDRRSRPRRAPRRRRPVRLPDARGAARASGDDRPGSSPGPRGRGPRRVRPRIPLPAVAHRRGAARARGHHPPRVPRRPLERGRERNLSAHHRDAGPRAPRRGLRRVAAGRARSTGARRAVRAGRPVPDDARAGPGATPRVHRRDAGRGTRMSRIDDYRRVARPGAVDFILKLAEQVKGRRFLHVTGGRLGGGATETLRAAVPILSELSVDTRWEVTGGDNAYYTTARSLQAALEGAERVLSEEGLARWADMNRLNAKKIDLGADIVLVHDGQPASLVSDRTAGRWVWRCSFDCSGAQAGTWSYFRQIVDQYDGAVFSLPGFESRLAIPMYVIPPASDPLSQPSREPGARRIGDLLGPLGVGRDKPLLVQIGPFSRAHDPLGVVNAYRLRQR